jgi:fibronectin type 3 domain-containing protein
VSVSGRNAQLSWDESSEAHTYRLYRRYSDEKDYKFIFDSTKTSYTDKYLDPGREYTYKLELIGEGGTSGAVTSDSVVISDTPVMQAVLQKKQNEFMLRWTGKKGATFEVYGESKDGSRKLGEAKGFSMLVKADAGISGFYVTDKNAQKSSDTLTALRQPRIEAVSPLDETTAVVQLSSSAESSYEVYRSASKDGNTPSRAEPTNMFFMT